ncbi:MAG: sigma-70 family RNA polymerase sigma factor [Sphingomonadales bacterium]|nr:sigma-70 family RNA polymerase sigma factor [Sphingomonadales bacterium]
MQAQAATEIAPERLSDAEFKRVMTATIPHLRAFARSLCGCRERADDLAQETLLKAWAARDRFVAGTSFKAWTFTILRNHYYSESRRNRFHGDYDQDHAERTLCTPAAQEDSSDLTDVLRAMAMLPATHREALILAAAGDMPYEEIADICGIAVGTVKSRICRARSMLETILDSGQLADFRHNFVLSGGAIDTLFAELGRIANANGLGGTLNAAA